MIAYISNNSFFLLLLGQLIYLFTQLFPSQSTLLACHDRAADVDRAVD